MINLRGLLTKVNQLPGQFEKLKKNHSILNVFSVIIITLRGRSINFIFVLSVFLRCFLKYDKTENYYKFIVA
jgi:hypothetical protein